MLFYSDIEPRGGCIVIGAPGGFASALDIKASFE